jgi:hypothetical protein
VPKAMQDGERREIKIPDDKFWKGQQALPTVIAIKIDCDTPYVEVQFKGQTLTLTDTDARGLYQKLIKAIDILPTSK